KLQGVKGPGLFFIVPILDNVTAVIDERIQTTAFSAEQALTKDTVPVNVDAIIFWHVHDAQKAALNITNYREAIDRVAQTSLREMIGASMLSALLSERKSADELLRNEISRKTANWGISVNSVEIRDARPSGPAGHLRARHQTCHSAGTRRQHYGDREQFSGQAPQPTERRRGQVRRQHLLHRPEWCLTS